MTPEMAVEVFLAAESFATNITKESRGILSEAHHLDHGQSLSMGTGREISIFLFFSFLFFCQGITSASNGF